MTSNVYSTSESASERLCPYYYYTVPDFRAVPAHRRSGRATFPVCLILRTGQRPDWAHRQVLNLAIPTCPAWRKPSSQHASAPRISPAGRGFRPLAALSARGCRDAAAISERHGRESLKASSLPEPNSPSSYDLERWPASSQQHWLLPPAALSWRSGRGRHRRPSATAVSPKPYLAVPDPRPQSRPARI